MKKFIPLFFCTDALPHFKWEVMKSISRMWMFHIIMALLLGYIMYAAFSSAPADSAATALATQIVDETAKTWQISPIIQHAAPQNVLDTKKINTMFQQLPAQMGAFQRVKSFVGRAGKISPVKNKADARPAATFKAVVLYDQGATELSITTIQSPDGAWKLFNYEVSEAQYVQSASPSATNQPARP